APAGSPLPTLPPPTGGWTHEWALDGDALMKAHWTEQTSHPVAGRLGKVAGPCQESSSRERGRADRPGRTCRGLSPGGLCATHRAAAARLPGRLARRRAGG